MEFKKCSKCKEDKLLENFSKRNGGKYTSSYCKSCVNLHMQEYRNKNKEKVREQGRRQNRKINYKKQYSELTPEQKLKRKERTNNWKKRNRDRINDKYNEYISIRIKEDPIYRLKENIRNLIRISIKSRGFNKTSKTFKILGCSIDEFKKYIESRFEPNMSWDNYPSWHLDHKIPISWAKTQEDVIKYNHFTNFQPKWAADNLLKSNKFCD